MHIEGVETSAVGRLLATHHEHDEDSFSKIQYKFKVQKRRKQSTLSFRKRESQENEPVDTPWLLKVKMMVSIEMEEKHQKCDVIDDTTWTLPSATWLFEQLFAGAIDVIAVIVFGYYGYNLLVCYELP